jgi:hypothetical protein
MKKLTFTGVQFALLLKVQEQISFMYNNIDDYIEANKDKEEFPDLEIDEEEYADFIDSLQQFEASLEEGEEKTEVTKWLEALTAEPVAEEVAETAAENVAEETVTEAVAEEVTEAGTETAAEAIIEPAAEEETGKQE